MENIVFKKMYDKMCDSEQSIYKTFSQPPVEQILDSDMTREQLINEIVFWVTLGLNIGVISVAFYVIWRIW